MKKTVYKIIFTFSVMLLLASCGQDNKPKEMYCGLGMSAFEVIDAKALAAKFQYSDADKTLLQQVKGQVTAQFPDKGIEVYFYHKDATTIGVYIVAPDDKAIVEKISCFLFESNLSGLPDTRKIVFYTNENNNLVAAVKTKPKA